MIYSSRPKLVEGEWIHMSQSLKVLRLALVTVLAFLVLATPEPLSAQRDRISGKLDGGPVAVLPGQFHPKAVAAGDQGPVDGAFQLGDMTIAFRPTSEQEADLATLLEAQQDPASPEYRQWLSPEQYAGRFGLSRSDIDAVTGWLEASGFRIHMVSPARNWIAFGGTAEQVGRAFGTEIHRYEVDGESHFANITEPSLPAGLANVVAAIRGLDDFLPRVSASRLSRLAAGGRYLTPADIAGMYNLQSLFDQGVDGTGQKLVIVGQSAVDRGDIDSFRSLFQLPRGGFDSILAVGRPDPGLVENEAAQAALALEWAGAVARNANLVYVYAHNAFDAVQYAVAQNLAPVIGMSHVVCEAGAPATAEALRLLARQANAQGISWIAASGDSGAACGSADNSLTRRTRGVNLPASLPEVTGVGGTTFSPSAALQWRATLSTRPRTGGHLPEAAWNETAGAASLAASSGGNSTLFARPWWQVAPGVPPDGARHIPDVSMLASAGLGGALVCSGGSCAGGAAGGLTLRGTSLAAPIFAGVAVLVNHYGASSGAAANGGLGNMNPTLYKLARNFGDAFHDVVSGGSQMPCDTAAENCIAGSDGFQAGPGYDFVTGLGSVDAYLLAAEWHLPRAASIMEGTLLSINPKTLLSGGVAVLTVTLPSPAPTGGATVTLTGGSPAFPAPASVPVAAGQTSNSVKVLAGTVTVATSVTVGAAYGGVTSSATVTVSPLALASLTAAPSVVGGEGAVVSVALNGPAPTDTTVKLTSSNATVFPTPASLVIKAGEKGVSAKLLTTAVNAATAITLTATLGGVSKTANVSVTPRPAPAPVALLAVMATAPANGEGSGTLAVLLTGPAPAGGVTVALTSSSATFPVPASVTVSAGESAAKLVVQLKVLNSATGGLTTTPVTVTATYNGVTKTTTVLLTPVAPPATTGPVALAALEVYAPASAGGSATLVVTLSGAAPTGGATVTLTSSNAIFPVPASITIPAGERAAKLAVATKAISSATGANTATPVTVTATYNGVSKTATVLIPPVATPPATGTGYAGGD